MPFSWRSTKVTPAAIPNIAGIAAGFGLQLHAVGTLLPLKLAMKLTLTVVGVGLGSPFLKIPFMGCHLYLQKVIRIMIQPM